jgi:hypothetical protein
MSDILMPLLGLSGGAVSPYYPVGSDCILYHAYWDGTAIDHSTYANDGTIVTGPTFVSGGLSFPGTGYVTTPHNSLGPGTGDFTMVLWFKTSASGVRRFCLFHNASGNDLPPYEQDGKLYLYTGFSSGSSPAYFYNGAAGPTINDNKWYNLVYAIKRDTGADIWLNGAAVASAVGPINALSVTYDNFAYIGGNDFLWSGLMGEFLYFVSHWTSTTVAAYYAATKALYGL